MGSKPSCIVEDQADLVFKNQVILRELLAMLPTRDICMFRSVNKAVYEMASNFLYVRGNKACKISDGIAMRNFLDRMRKRLDPAPCYISFSLGVCGIPMTGIKRFCEEMAPYVRELEIDLVKVPYLWYLWRNNGRESDYRNKGKVKTIQLLKSFFYLERLHLTLVDGDEENVLDAAEWQAVPPFPMLRFIHCTHVDVLPQLFQRTSTFFVAAVQRSPNLEHVIIEGLHMSTGFRNLPALLSAYPQPPALSMNLSFPLAPPMVSSVYWQMIRDITDRGFNRLRTFDCRITLADNQSVNVLTAFLSLQTQSLETLSLTCACYIDANPAPWIFPTFPNVTSVKMVFYWWSSIAIPVITNQHFPKCEERKYQWNTYFTGA